MSGKNLGMNILSAMAIATTLSACGSGQSDPTQASPDTDNRQTQDAQAESQKSAQDTATQNPAGHATPSAAPSHEPTRAPSPVPSSAPSLTPTPRQSPEPAHTAAPIAIPSATLSPLPGPSTNSQPEGPRAESALKQTYVGTDITLLAPHDAYWGYIKINGKDGEALYKALQVETKTEPKGNAVWLPASVRQGYDISCYKQAMKATPKQPEYSCSIYISYRTGSVLRKAHLVKTSHTSSELKNDYTGKKLRLTANSPEAAGSLKLEGEDARVLYSSMTIDSVRGEKRGHDLTCVEKSRRSSSQKEYSCSVRISYRTGVVVPTDAR